MESLQNLFFLQNDSYETLVLEFDDGGTDNRVLLVDRDADACLSTGRTIFNNSINKVTMVVSNSMARKIIGAGKKQVDMAIIDVNLADVDSFQLCKEIKKAGILVVAASVSDDPELTYKALDSGAFLLIKKPIDAVTLKYLHQILMKQRIIKTRKGMDGEIGSMKNLSSDEILVVESTTEDARKKRKYQRKNDNLDQDNVQRNQINLNEACSFDILNRKKTCVEWTSELHQKFMDAVSQLGEGRCFPKEILELMNVPGLTRMHVASHLQKCRCDSWRNPAERKKKFGKGEYCALADVAKINHKKNRSFGNMPQVSAFGNKPLEKLKFGSGNNFIGKQKTSERWKGPSEGSSLMWMDQEAQLLNPYTWTPTLNSVPSLFGNGYPISENYNNIISEFLPEGEELNYLLPEIPNFTPGHKFGYCEPNPPQQIINRANEATGPIEFSLSNKGN